MFASPMECAGRQEDLVICSDLPACDEAYESCSPLNGLWDEWADWSSCSCAGVKERHRAIKRHATCGGEPVTGPEIEAINCPPTCHKDEPIECVVSDWTEWSKCDLMCGGGEKTASRKITQNSTNCGETCDADLQKTAPCNTQACDGPIDCEVSDWTPWSPCSVSCDGGQKNRSRHFAHLAQYGGDGCDDIYLNEVAPCGETCCEGEPQDCEWGAWSAWGDCSQECDGGHQTRVKVLEKEPRITGALCESADVMEQRACNTQACDPYAQPKDGLWGSWGEWSICSVTCDSGYRFRQRDIAQQPARGGAGVTGDAQDYEICYENPCSHAAIDCAFAAWSEWGACSSTLKGTQTRSRETLTQAEGGGKPCAGSMHEVRACNDAKMAEALGYLDCQWGEWEQYGFCSKTCGGGQKARVRQIKQLRVGGGAECEGSQKETHQCNAQLCNGPSDMDHDCVWSPWSDWGDCDAQCGGGEKKRYRYISESAMNYGKQCHPKDSREVMPCNTHQCGKELFCVWAEWGDYTPCSATCGAGTKKRNRVLEQSHAAVPGALDTTYLALGGVTLSGPSAFALSGSAGFAAVLGAVALARIMRRSSYGTVQE
jgi:hypothetical protein